jgi:hypothetical protein
MDLGALAPDEPAAEEPAMDLGALAPDEPVAEEPAMDLGALAPDEPMAEEPAMDLGALAPHGPTADDVHTEDGEPVYTRTLAELYVRQGLTDRALEVYRRLAEAEPGATDLRVRIAELEGRPVSPEYVAEEGGGATSATGAAEPAPTAAEDAHDVETLARDLAESGAEAHDVDTPFAWSGGDGSPGLDSAAEREDSGPPAVDYFEGLLGWGSGEDS